MERVLEFHTAPRTGKGQYLIRWKRYGIDEDGWINFEDISLEIIEDFWTSGHYSNTLEQRRSYKKLKKHHTRETPK